MRIILTRHGKPQVAPGSSIYACELREWIAQYNQAGIDKNSHPTEQVICRAKNCNIIVCSSLPRSKLSAEILAEDTIVHTYSELVEAGLPSAEWRGVKLRPGFWSLIFRLLWYFGYSIKSESYTDAKKRAREAAVKLADIAEAHNSVMFMGHGIFNRLVAAELRALGWSGPRYPDSGYWGCSEYTN